MISNAVMKLAALVLTLAPLTLLAQVKSATRQEIAVLESSLQVILKLNSVQTRGIQFAPSPVQGGYLVCGEVLVTAGPMQPKQFRKFHAVCDMLAGYPAVVIGGVDNERTNQSSVVCQKLGM